MEILRVLAVWLLGILTVFLMISLLLPDEVQISAKKKVAAPAKQVWPQLRYFRNWSGWFSLSDEDSLKFEIQGDDGREGASIQWMNAKGNDVVSTLRHKQSVSRKSLMLKYQSPTKGYERCEMGFSLNESGDSTEIQFELRYRLPFFRRFASLFYDQELQNKSVRMLDKLVQRVISLPFVDPGQVEQESHFGIKYALLKDSISLAEFNPAWLDEQQNFLLEWLKDEGLKSEGGPQVLVFAPDSSEKWQIGMAYPLTGNLAEGIDSLSDTLFVMEKQVKQFPEWTENLQALKMKEVFQYLTLLQLELEKTGLKVKWPAILRFGSDTSGLPNVTVRLHHERQITELREE